MENTNTNPHAGIDYIMPGEEEDCGIVEEVTESDITDSQEDEMKDFALKMADIWGQRQTPDKYAYQNQRKHFYTQRDYTTNQNYNRYSNSGPNA
tara:strand:- start:153 stop:434 length:282 start_codon:yes stop_codon:yes gene_type:complete